MDDDAQREAVEQLLAQGLDYYGVDDVANAILTWERVLEIDPENAEAQDYIKTADRRSKPRPKKKKASADTTRGDGPETGMLAQVRELLREDRIAAAYEMIASCHPNGSAPDLAWEATVDLARSRRYAELRRRMGNLTVVPRLKASDADLRGYNLPPNAGFLVSMVDGMTAIADLISVSGMDAFDVLHTLEGLVTAGLVELEA
jgi:hypothetical protein